MHFINSPIRYLPVAGMFAVALAANVMAAEPFTLTSQTFKDGQMMPRKVSNTAASHNPVNKNCVGDNVSPQLSWSHAPEGTRSFALIVEEPEGRGATGTHHLVVYGIAASVTAFAEGELGKQSAKFVGGKSSHDVGVYSGPCTAPGAPHHYAHILIATDFDPKQQPAGLTREEFLARLVPEGGKSHALATTSIVGMFQNRD
jgi:Raf kinase inhibitor-like YbhB/YbcL family protein